MVIFHYTNLYTFLYTSTFTKLRRIYLHTLTSFKFVTVFYIYFEWFDALYQIFFNILPKRFEAHFFFNVCIRNYPVKIMSNMRYYSLINYVSSYCVIYGICMYISTGISIFVISLQCGTWGRRNCYAWHTHKRSIDTAHIVWCFIFQKCYLEIHSCYGWICRKKLFNVCFL